MGVIIKVYSNHSLSIDNYFGGIMLLENKLGIKIENNRGNIQEKTDTQKSIRYFANYEYFNIKFNEGWGIWVNSNYRLCSRFVIYKHFIEFDITGNINLKTHIWRKLVSGKHDYLSDSITLKEWNDTREFISEITQKLNGNTIIYLNDGSDGLNIGEEMIWDNKDMDFVYEALSKVIPPRNYSELQSCTSEFTNKNWFIEKI